MTWLHNNIELTQIPEGYLGFVYLITNLTNNKKYIGEKLFYFSKTKSVKGKKKRVKVESDWQTYWSSSENLKEDVALLGEENFKREILYLCKSKGNMNYIEAREQMDNRVLEKPDEYYNGIINCRVSRSHIKLGDFDG